MTVVSNQYVLICIVLSLHRQVSALLIQPLMVLYAAIKK